MIMMQSRIYRSDVQMNATVFYCFGDNDEREGLGGQAAEMRGEPNAIGIRTKKSPSNHPSAFYSDDQYDDNCVKIGSDFLTVEQKLREGHVVVFPTDGFGTGLSDLANRAPRTLAYIEGWVNRLVAEYDDNP